MKTKKHSISQETARSLFYKSLEEACNYNAEKATQIIVKSLKDIALAQGGMASLSCKTGLSRTSLYKTFNNKTDGRLGTYIKIMFALMGSLVNKKADHL